MSHSQLMLKGRLSVAWPLALTISSSTCVCPFWQRESSLGFPICTKRALAQVLSIAKHSGRNDFPSKEAKLRNPKWATHMYYHCMQTKSVEILLANWKCQLADNRLGSRLRCCIAVRDIVGTQRVQKKINWGFSQTSLKFNTKQLILLRFYFHDV